MRARKDQRSDCGRPLVFAWTDGSAPGDNRHGPAAWAAIIRWGAGPDAERRTLGGRLSEPNIARAELAAAIHALRALHQPACVTMHCDHEALINGATARGTPRAHRDLWNELREVSASHHVTWVWVRAHHTSRGNRAADSLARAVRKGSRLDEGWREDLRAGRVANAVNHLVQIGRLRTLAWDFSTVGPLHRPTHIATAATVDGDTGEPLAVTGTGSSKAAAKTDALTRLIAALHLE
ncbi:RNase H family protein [Actinoallomurus iriomotensis]